MSKLITLDYDGIPVDFTGDAWFNATTVASRFGKRPGDWLRLPETKRYVAALEARGKVKESHFARTKKGGMVGAAGTWLHPKLGVRFAQWLDVNFAIWCDEQVELILRGGLADWRRSTVEDRFEMQIEAMRAAIRRGKSWSHVIGWGNRWAGVTRSRYLSVGQVRDVGGFYGRVGTFTETSADLTRIEVNSISLYGECRQLSLLSAKENAPTVAAVDASMQSPNTYMKG